MMKRAGGAVHHHRLHLEAVVEVDLEPAQVIERRDGDYVAPFDPFVGREHFNRQVEMPDVICRHRRRELSSRVEHLILDIPTQGDQPREDRHQEDRQGDADDL